MVVEVVSPGTENARRDRDAKLALYSRRDALEYWIVDPQTHVVQGYARPQGDLARPLAPRAEVHDADVLRSDLLAGFAVRVDTLWP